MPRSKDESGFTLIELLVVMIIIGILAAIAVPVFLHQREKGWDSQAVSDARNAAQAEETTLADSGAYTEQLPVPTSGFSSFTPSNGVTTYVKVNGTDGYCVLSKSKSGRFFTYDSSGGGIVPAGGFTTLPASWPAGSTCGALAPTFGPYLAGL